eukprot:966956-Rhodomonas_salina.4
MIRTPPGRPCTALHGGRSAGGVPCISRDRLTLALALKSPRVGDSGTLAVDLKVCSDPPAVTVRRCHGRTVTVTRIPTTSTSTTQASSTTTE